MNYTEARTYLDNLQMHKIKLGLDSMKSFLGKVGNPEGRLKFVHIAGTNGKGSVSMNIVSVLKRTGYKIGLFTSPHLSSVRERFRVNDRFITEEEFARHASTVREVLGEDMITYFEFTTALALLWFQEEDVDLVVLETGLGGRLDATNVVEPIVSVITNVSMDHEAYLGDNLGSIAYEKAGIIKGNVPVVTGVGDDEGREVVLKRCQDLNSTCFLYGRDFLSEGTGKCWSWTSAINGVDEKLTGLECGMRGEYQVSNSSLALATLQLLKGAGFFFTGEDVVKGLKDVLWPGRLEHIVLDRNTGKQLSSTDEMVSGAVQYLIDGAHNPAGVSALVQTLQVEYEYKKLIVVWGAMEDKDLSLTVTPVADLASTLILTQPEGERAAKPEMLLDVLSKEIHPKCRCIEDVSDALELARDEAGSEDLVVVAGSLYLIGEVRKKLVGELVGK